MKNSVRVLNICLILGMTLFVMSAQANNLNKLDIKRSSSSPSTLNVTLYTANPYDENIAVSKKSDNKYVILMPNVTGSGASNVDFSSIKDVVSNVDVKTVSDGSTSYTKVTLTTSKPVSINTSTRKTAPLTDEQKAYKNLIAQSRSAASSSSSAQSNSSSAKTTAPKSYVITADGISTDMSTPIRPKSVVEQVKMLVKDNKTESANNQKNSNVPTSSIAFDSASITNSDKSLLAENPIEQKKAEKVKNTAKTSTDSLEKSTLDTNDVSPKNDASVGGKSESPLLEAINNNKLDKVFPSENGKKYNQNMLTSMILLLVLLLGILAIFKNIKKSLEHSAVLKKNFKENLHEKPVVIEDYSNITEDKTLNWQQKYHKFIDSIGEVAANTGILKEVAEGEYILVNSAEAENKSQEVQQGFSELLDSVYETEGNAVLKPKEEPKLKAYNKPAVNYSPDSVPTIKKVKNPELSSSKDNTRKLELVKSNKNKNNEDNIISVTSHLEKAYAVSPSVERLDNVKDDNIIIKQLEDSFKMTNLGSGFAINEEDVITESLRRSPKLRSFANKIALEQTHRRHPAPKQRSEIIRTKYLEAKQVNIDNSSLYSPARKFSDANLSSADLLSSSNFKSTSSSKVSNPITKNGEYGTVSVDEFFDIIEGPTRATASATAASRVADRLGKMSIEFIKPSDRKKAKSQRNILADKIVKAGYNIDENSGFYIIENGDGTTSLIGRVNNEITVLKEFNGSVPDKLQVRQDSDNVYIIRAAGERYMVEINEEKMSILLEL